MSSTTKKSTFQSNNQQTTQMSSSFHQSTKNGQGTSTTDQLIQLMGQVNGAVKAGDFSTELANKIFTLCQQLKNNGQKLEQTNKADLNKVFVSLRQACCRDSGQLGTPCRLKIMELIELRAMGWKTNLSHSQYYLNKAEKVNGQSDIQIQTQNFSSPPSTKNYQSNTNNSQKPTQSNFGQQQLYQPSMQSVPQQFGNFAQPPPPLYMPPEMSSQPQIQQAAPSYFLIPAAGAWTPQMIPSGMLPSPQFSHQIRQPPPQQLAPDWLRQVAAAHFKGPPPQMSQSAYLPGSSSTLNSKSIKQPQLREEVTIKNSDSGKIMGVKGRRVAAVEEMSKTVISFQKVDGNSRYRTLAITGTTQESIQHAKRLIEETIKRNVSPNRIDLNGSDMTQQNVLLTGKKVVGEEKNEDSLDDEEDDEEDDEPGISIEANKDGTLKVSCADPEMLQAAQQALTEYLNLRTNRMSAEERELRKERRKSMPLQSSSNAVPVQNVVPKSVEEKPNGSLSDSHKKLTGSTPNLLADSIVPDLEAPSNTNLDNSTDDVLRYERNEMLLVKDQVQTQLKNEPQNDSKFDKTQLPFTKGSNDKVEEKTDG